MDDDTEKTKRGREIGGLCIPGGLFIGLGLGWALGYLVPGLLVGLGVGFLAMALVQLKVGKG